MEKRLSGAALSGNDGLRRTLEVTLDARARRKRRRSRRGPPTPALFVFRSRGVWRHLPDLVVPIAALADRHRRPLHAGYHGGRHQRSHFSNQRPGAASDRTRTQNGGAFGACKEHGFARSDGRDAQLSLERRVARSWSGSGERPTSPWLTTFAFAWRNSEKRSSPIRAGPSCSSTNRGLGISFATTAR